MESQSLGCHASWFFLNLKTPNSRKKKKVICSMSVHVLASSGYTLKSHIHHSVDIFCQFVQVSEGTDCPCREMFFNATTGEGRLLYLVSRSKRCC